MVGWDGDNSTMSWRNRLHGWGCYIVILTGLLVLAGVCWALWNVK
jgi:hypothetical protein